MHVLGRDHAIMAAADAYALASQTGDGTAQARVELWALVEGVEPFPAQGAVSADPAGDRYDDGWNACAVHSVAVIERLEARVEQLEAAIREHRAACLHPKEDHIHVQANANEDLWLVIDA